MEQNSILKHCFKINTVFTICVNLIETGSFTGQAVTCIFKFVENLFIIKRKHMALDTKKGFENHFYFLDLYMRRK